MRGVAKKCRGTSGCRCMNCIVRRRRTKQSEQNRRRWAARSKKKQSAYKPPTARTAHKRKKKSSEPSAKDYYARLNSDELVEVLNDNRKKSNYEKGLIKQQYRKHGITKKVEGKAIKRNAKIARKHKIRRILSAIFNL